jgi:DHA2 family multidrug resistance protein
MNEPHYFQPWLTKWSFGVRATLFLILLSAIMQFGSFTLSQNYIVSYFGAQSEDIVFAIQMTYVGILCNVPIVFRLLRHYEVRNYIALNIFFGIVLNICCLNTRNLLIFFILRFLQGISINAICVGVLVIITNVLEPSVRKVFAPTVFFGTVLSSTVVVGLIAANATLTSEIIDIYVYIIVFQCVVLAIVFLGFKKKSLMRQVPLGKIDWVGLIFFATSGVALAYTLLYGSKYYWFTDQRIVYSTVIVVLFAGLFMWRQATTSRPLMDLYVFKNHKFIAGLLLLGIYYGIKESINLIYNYTAVVLHWSPFQTAELGFCNILGLVIFMVITAQILIKSTVSVSRFLVTGFTMLLLYHLWVNFYLTPDLSFNDLALPVFLQGAASGILFVPISLFIITSVPESSGVTPLFIAANTRYVSLLNANAGFYNLQLYFNQHYRYDFLAHLTTQDEVFREKVTKSSQSFMSRGYSNAQAAKAALVSLQNSLTIQTQLLTIRAVFSLASIIIAVILITVIVTRISIKIRYGTLTIKKNPRH